MKRFIFLVLFVCAGMASAGPDLILSDTIPLTLADTAASGAFVKGVILTAFSPLYPVPGMFKNPIPYTSYWRKIYIEAMDSISVAHACSLTIAFYGWDGVAFVAFDSVTVGNVSIDSTVTMATRVKLDSVAALRNADQLYMHVYMWTKPADVDSLLEQADYGYPIKLNVKLTGRY